MQNEKSSTHHIGTKHEKNVQSDNDPKYGHKSTCTYWKVVQSPISTNN